MGDGIDVRALLNERRKRTVGAIMQHAERELYPGMSPKQQAEFRTKVIEAVGSYHDLMIDLTRSLAGASLVNTEALELLARIDANAERAARR